MKLDPTPIPAAAPVCSHTGRSHTGRSHTGRAHRRGAQARHRRCAVWTDLLWLMPPDRTVTITVDGGKVAVELGPAAPARCAISH